jgi:hypothetical protein
MIPYATYETCFEPSRWQVTDEFLPDPERMLQSALTSGFGKWRPNKGDMGPDYFDGVNFYGDHARGVRSITQAWGPIYPNKMFFRVTTEKTDPAVVHSDRLTGDVTCLVYLTPHEDSGTEFYRHRPTGLFALPPVPWLLEHPDLFTQLKKDCSGRDPEVWEKIGAAEARWNRALFFPSPVFHCRYPYTGFGQGEDKDGRIIWGCHFMVEGSDHV